MRKLIIILAVGFFIIFGGGVLSGCSKKTSSNRGVAASKRNKCVTTKPSTVGFLYWVECGFKRK